ncbi:MAG: hypothetical protein ABI947_18040 [Chloroflexota bacterium]
MIPHTYRRDGVIITVLALIVGTVMAILLKHPGYTDAYYYFNAGQRLAQGKGLTDAALWTYIGAPTSLPAPSHLYWMPMASLVAAVGLFIGDATFDAAQLLFVPLYAGIVLIGFTLGALIGKTRRTAWIAGLLTMFSGFYMAYWTTTSTFAPYGFAGALSLLAMGLGRRSGGESGSWRWFALSGAMAAFAHLTRADGVLLLIVLIIVAVWPRFKQIGIDSSPASPSPNSERGLGGEVKRTLRCAAVGIIAYLLVMTPWFVRNLNTVGAILPPGGFQTAWMRSYDEIANYPPGSSLADFIAWGPENILNSRWEALKVNVGRFVGEQGQILLTPFMLLALWKRRRDPLLSGLWLYALGLHLAMTFVFAFPGYRGGLFHSASALIPFWAALGIVGLDDVLAWIAPRRRWRLPQARLFFGAALLVWAILFSINIFLRTVNSFNSAGGNFVQIASHLPADSVVMINDPSAFYYFTGLSGVVVPNAPPDVIPELAKRYGVTDIVLDNNVTLPMRPLYEGTISPPFLEPLYHDDFIRIYRVK